MQCKRSALFLNQCEYTAGLNVPGALHQLPNKKFVQEHWGALDVGIRSFWTETRTCRSITRFCCLCDLCVCLCWACLVTLHVWWRVLLCQQLYKLKFLLTLACLHLIATTAVLETLDSSNRLNYTCDRTRYVPGKISLV